ncbi:hypothetical protein L208DRAFT_1389270 [Tricholoma matsutake]|nr:hypothetical protein L208DRAFT_1389270 [Tricholoma matsutake 945]
MDAEPEKSDLESLADDINNEELEDWEAELNESVQDQRSPQKKLSLSQLNQLLNISNFATLCLKGISQTQAICVLARHYQIFEALLIEKCGGSGNSRSWLYDKQKTGDGISECTAHRWLIKLGWHQTVVQKGVYMDGHERNDVVEYQNKFEALMARHKGPELKKIMPEIHKGHLWLREGKQPLWKKGQGRLIHVSYFVNEEDGQLDTQEVIYPSTNRDPWWDTKQLIFKSAHPDCESSTHASLPPNALKAFKMNKSDDRKQHQQRDTTIPQSNPDLFNVSCLKAKSKIVAWPGFSLSRKIL